MKNSIITLTVAGETLHLLPQRAVFWPAQHLLMIADIHFGKAAAFRAKGVPVPHGTTTQNLEAVDTLLQAHPVQHIVFLGDFLHAKAAQGADGLSRLVAWRDQYPSLRLTLVRGNHDRHAGDPPAQLNMELVDEPYCLGPFALCHHPDPRSGSYVLAGHVHPVFRLTAAGDSVRLPCFLFGPETAILPSFGAFTGGYQVVQGRGDRVFITTDDAVFEVPYRS